MRLLKKIITPAGWKIGLLTTLACVVIYWIGIPFFHMMELTAYNLHFYSRGAAAPGKEVVIAAIDEKSLNAYGRWPWPRTRIAELVKSLNAGGAAVVAFDIVFAYPDESSGIGAIRAMEKRFKGSGHIETALRALEKGADNDANLASALRETPNSILGYYFFLSKDEVSGGKNAPEAGAGEYMTASAFNMVRPLDDSSGDVKLMGTYGVKESLPVLSEAAADFGYFNIVPDSDGVIRWAPLVMRYGDSFYPHLSLVAIRKYMGGAPLIMNVAAYGVDSIEIGGLAVPTNERGNMTINYRGGAKTFPHYSIADIINGEVPKEALSGKIVLVGATATGIYDMRATPFSATFSGVEVHANIIDNILHSDYISRPDWVMAADALAIVLSGALLSLTIPLMRPIYATLLTVAAILAFILANGVVFNYLHIWAAEVYPVFSMVMVSAVVTTFQFMTEEKKKRELKGAFSQYVSPALVTEILKNPDRLALGGEERRITVLFSDIRGFTTISEGLKPDALVKLINDYLTPMTDVVLRKSGTIDKYMGDAIMAFWNAPLDQPNHPTLACAAALEMLKKLDELAPVWEKAGIKRLDIGIGISTGKAIVGNMGSSMRFDYTVIGDTINLGSRLEGLNKEYGTHIIVPKFTYLDIKDEFILRELDYVRVKGKNLPIQIFELMGHKAEQRHLVVAKLYEQGLSAYRQKLWTMAEGYFKQVLDVKPGDGPSKAFVSRIEVLREDEDLPQNWDGVFVMTKK